MKALTPIIFIIASVAIFFGFIDSHYNGIKVLQEKQTELKGLLAKADELKGTRDSLQAKFRNIPMKDKEQLAKLLPDNIDNIRLILYISQIAEEEVGIKIRNFNIDTQEVKSESKSVANAEARPYGIIRMDFSVSAPYETFLKFLNKLETSLRLVDITELSVSAGKNGINDYRVRIQTYWLR